jgi:hypothetical protein
MRLARRQGVHQARYQLAQPAPPGPARRRLRPSCRGQARGPRCRRSRYHGPFGRIRTFTRTDRSRLSYGAKCFLSALSLTRRPTCPEGSCLDDVDGRDDRDPEFTPRISARHVRPSRPSHPAAAGSSWRAEDKEAFRCAVYQGKETEGAD